MKYGMSKYLANKLKRELNQHLMHYEYEGRQCEVLRIAQNRWEVRVPHPSGGYSLQNSQRAALETLGRIPARK